MPEKFEHTFSPSKFRAELAEHDHDLGVLPGWMFEGLILYTDDEDLSTSNGATSVVQPRALRDPGSRMKQAINTAKFAGAEFTTNSADENITHVLTENDKSRTRILREKFFGYVSHSVGSFS